MQEYSALVIEPNKDFALRLEHILEGMNIFTLVCESPERATSLLDTLEPSLVLLDLDQPPRAAVMLLGKMRDRGITSPVLWLTRSPSSDVIERVRASGAQGVLEKSSDDYTMKSAIRALLCGDMYFAPQLTSPATPGAKAIAESERLLKILHQG